jgi:DNA-binding CsgD family transcriptional regulator
MGFDWLGYGRLGRRGDQLVPVSFCTTYANTLWARQYFAHSYAQVDPRLTEAFHSALPYFWSIDDLRLRPSDDTTDSKLPSFIEGLSEAGVRSGALLVLADASGSEVGHFVSFLSRAPQESALQDGRLGQLLTFALCLHEFYSRYCRQPLGVGTASGGVSLNPLQRNILDRVARGASDKQIAYELQLSSHAVDYHMRQLRRRFAARNRVQLTQAASRAAAG